MFCGYGIYECQQSQVAPNTKHWSCKSIDAVDSTENLYLFSNFERILNSDPVYERNTTWTSLGTKLSSESNFFGRSIIYQHLLLGKTKLRAVFHIASPPATTDITTWLELNGKSVLDTVFVFSIDLSNFDWEYLQDKHKTQAYVLNDVGAWPISGVLLRLGVCHSCHTCHYHSVSWKSRFNMPPFTKKYSQ